MSFTHSLEPIGKTILGSAASPITFTSIPSTYRNLLLILDARSNAAAVPSDSLSLRFNSDASNNYASGGFAAASASTISQFGMLGTSAQLDLSVIPASTAPASYVSSLYLWIHEYNNTNWFKTVISRQMSAFGASGSTEGMNLVVCMWRNTAAINRIDLFSNNFDVNTIATLYGQA